MDKLNLLVLLSTSLIGYIYGDIHAINPSQLQHGQWQPRIDSSTSNYYQDGVHYSSQLPSGQIQGYRHPTVQGHRRVDHHGNFGQQPIHHVPTQTPPLNKMSANFPAPMPRHDEVKEKLGFGSLSSLVPTSLFNSPQQQQGGYAYSENSIIPGNGYNYSITYSELPQSPPEQTEEIADENAKPSLLSSLFQGFKSSESQAPDSYQNQEEPIPEPEPTSMENEASDGIFSGLKNILPFGSGFLSGMLNGNNENEEENANQDSPNFGLPNFLNRDQTTESSYTIFGGNSNQGLSSPDSNNAFSNGNNEAAQQDGGYQENNDESSGSSFLSSLNPFTKIRDLFGDLKLPNSDEGYNDDGNVNQVSLADPSLTSIAEVEDSTGSPLQSLVGDSGVGGVLRPLLSITDKLKNQIGESLPWMQTTSLLMMPVYGTAFAAAVIGIVYICIYVPGWAIRNEDLDGQFYIMSIRQILNVVGITDPIGEFLGVFGFKRSFDGRAFGPDGNGTFALDAKRKAYLTGNTYESGHCVERLACELVGRKLSNSSWQDGYFVRGIKLMTNSTKTDTLRRLETSSWPSIRFTKILIEAIGVGLTRFNEIINTGRSTGPYMSPCLKYSCDARKSIRKMFNKYKPKYYSELKLKKSDVKPQEQLLSSHNTTSISNSTISA